MFLHLMVHLSKDDLHPSRDRGASPLVAARAWTLAGSCKELIVFSSLQILFVAGLAFVIGLERTFRFFFQKHKMKATSFFLGGVCVVLIGWPIVGVVLEVYGFFLLFR